MAATPETLLRTLARLQVASASELATALGVSQPTVSRLVAQAGARVLRMGRARATRYALTRELPGLGSQLPVYRVTEAGRVEELGALDLLHAGRTWLETTQAGRLFEGMPPFAADMSPQGYMGRTFAARHPELGLPERITDWSDDHRLIALARRGEDCVGDVVLGRESLDRWLATRLTPLTVSQYPALGLHGAAQQAGSSAGGEHPKFLAYVDGRHVLVKFAGSEGPAELRWRDLLVCESLALEQLREAGLPAVRARWLDEGGMRFLEVERFDRVGERGRRGVLSFAALDAELVGSGGPWGRVAEGLHAAGHLGAEDLRRVLWLDAFGQLIGNTDRHLGNLSVFAELDLATFQLAPVYDMLPMLFAPAGTRVVERTYQPAPPTADNREVWPEAARHASAYWERLVACADLSDELRRRAEACLTTLAELRERAPV